MKTTKLLALALVVGVLGWDAPREAQRVNVRPQCSGGPGPPPRPAPPPPGTNHGPGASAPGTGRSSVPSAGATAGPAATPVPWMVPPSVFTPASPATLDGRAPMTGATGETSTAPSWWSWWEWNRLNWLRPNRDDERRLDGDVTQVRTELGKRRARLLPLLERSLQDSSSEVRQAAVVAWARAHTRGSQADLLLLRGMLDDPNHGVRSQALLAFGALRSEEAVHALLEILGTPGMPTIANDERPLAVLALGVARANGFGEGAAAMIPGRDGSSGYRNQLATAAAMNHALVPDPRLLPRVRAASGLFAEGDLCREARSWGESPGLMAQARAIETLRLDPGPDTTGVLLEALDAERVEVRRSAVMALADRSDSRVLPALRELLEEEKEPLTRGFALLSLGRAGGQAGDELSLAVLKKELLQGPSLSKPWSAVALGLFADAAGAGTSLANEACKPLRSAYGRQRNQEVRAAYLLAFGIAQDAKAFDVLRHQLRLAKSDLERACAADSLAMLRDSRACELLRRALVRERSAAARTAQVQALGVLGDEDDAERLGRFLATGQNAIAVQAANALGFHGTPAAVDALAAAVEGGELGALPRAAALRALGLALDPGEPFVLARLSAHANFTAFPHWLEGAVATSL